MNKIPQLVDEISTLKYAYSSEKERDKHIKEMKSDICDLISVDFGFLHDDEYKYTATFQKYLR